MSQDSTAERQVTTELEHGDGSHVAALFSGKSEDERLKSLSIMRQLYQNDRKAGATKADLDFNAHAWYHPIIEIDRDGNALYSDLLDLDTMKHTDPHDTVPVDRNPIDAKQLRQVTTDLENGQPASLKVALDGKFLEERAHYFEAVSALNKKDVADHKTQVTLDYNLQGPKMMGNQMSIYRNAPGGFFTANYWSNPYSVYCETLNLDSGARDISLQSDSRK